MKLKKKLKMKELLNLKMIKNIQKEVINLNKRKLFN